MGRTGGKAPVLYICLVRCQRATIWLSIQCAQLCWCQWIAKSTLQIRTLRVWKIKKNATLLKSSRIAAARDVKQKAFYTCLGNCITCLSVDMWQCAECYTKELSIREEEFFREFTNWLHLLITGYLFNLLKTKHSLFYIINQSVPRCKHFPPRL